jgi:hypothetical protein
VYSSADWTDNLLVIYNATEAFKTHIMDTVEDFGQLCAGVKEIQTNRTLH